MSRESGEGKMREKSKREQATEWIDRLMRDFVDIISPEVAKQLEELRSRSVKNPSDVLKKLQTIESGLRDVRTEKQEQPSELVEHGAGTLEQGMPMPKGVDEAAPAPDEGSVTDLKSRLQKFLHVPAYYSSINKMLDTLSKPNVTSKNLRRAKGLLEQLESAHGGAGTEGIKHDETADVFTDLRDIASVKRAIQTTLRHHPKGAILSYQLGQHTVFVQFTPSGEKSRIRSKQVGAIGEFLFPQYTYPKSNLFEIRQAELLLGRGVVIRVEPRTEALEERIDLLKVGHALESNAISRAEQEALEAATADVPEGTQHHIDDPVPIAQGAPELPDAETPPDIEVQSYKEKLMATIDHFLEQTGISEPIRRDVGVKGSPYDELVSKYLADHGGGPLTPDQLEAIEYTVRGYALFAAVRQGVLKPEQLCRNKMNRPNERVALDPVDPLVLSVPANVLTPLDYLKIGQGVVVGAPTVAAQESAYDTAAFERLQKQVIDFARQKEWHKIIQVCLDIVYLGGDAKSSEKEFAHEHIARAYRYLGQYAQSLESLLLCTTPHPSIIRSLYLVLQELTKDARSPGMAPNVYDDALGLLTSVQERIPESFRNSGRDMLYDDGTKKVLLFSSLTQLVREAKRANVGVEPQPVVAPLPAEPRPSAPPEVHTAAAVGAEYQGAGVEIQLPEAAPEPAQPPAEPVVQDELERARSLRAYFDDAFHRDDWAEVVRTGGEMASIDSFRDDWGFQWDMSVAYSKLSQFGMAAKHAATAYSKGVPPEELDRVKQYIFFYLDCQANALGLYHSNTDTYNIQDFDTLIRLVSSLVTSAGDQDIAITDINGNPIYVLEHFRELIKTRELSGSLSAPQADAPPSVSELRQPSEHEQQRIVDFSVADLSRILGQYGIDRIQMVLMCLVRNESDDAKLIVKRLFDNVQQLSDGDVSVFGYPSAEAFVDHWQNSLYESVFETLTTLSDQIRQRLLCQETVMDKTKRFLKDNGKTMAALAAVGAGFTVVASGVLSPMLVGAGLAAGVVKGAAIGAATGGLRQLAMPKLKKFFGIKDITISQKPTGDISTVDDDKINEEVQDTAGGRDALILLSQMLRDASFQIQASADTVSSSANTELFVQHALEQSIRTRELDFLETDAHVQRERQLRGMVSSLQRTQESIHRPKMDALLRQSPHLRALASEMAAPGALPVAADADKKEKLGQIGLAAATGAVIGGLASVDSSWARAAASGLALAKVGYRFGESLDRVDHTDKVLKKIEESLVVSNLVSQMEGMDFSTMDYNQKVLVEELRLKELFIDLSVLNVFTSYLHGREVQTVQSNVLDFVQEHVARLRAVRDSGSILSGRRDVALRVDNAIYLMDRFLLEYVKFYPVPDTRAGTVVNMLEKLNKEKEQAVSKLFADIKPSGIQKWAYGVGGMLAGAAAGGYLFFAPKEVLSDQATEVQSSGDQPVAAPDGSEDQSSTDVSPATYAQGMNLLGQGTPQSAQQAEEIFRALIERNADSQNDNIGARHNLGIALERQGRYDEAMEQYQDILRYDPDNRYALESVGRVRSHGVEPTRTEPTSPPSPRGDEASASITVGRGQSMSGSLDRLHAQHPEVFERAGITTRDEYVAWKRGELVRLGYVSGPDGSTGHPMTLHPGAEIRLSGSGDTLQVSVGEEHVTYHARPQFLDAPAEASVVPEVPASSDVADATTSPHEEAILQSSGDEQSGLSERLSERANRQGDISDRDIVRELRAGDDARFDTNRYGRVSRSEARVAVDAVRGELTAASAAPAVDTSTSVDASTGLNGAAPIGDVDHTPTLTGEAVSPAAATPIQPIEGSDSQVVFRNDTASGQSRVDVVLDDHVLPRRGLVNDAYRDIFATDDLPTFINGSKRDEFDGQIREIFVLDQAYERMVGQRIGSVSDTASLTAAVHDKIAAIIDTHAASGALPVSRDWALRYGFQMPNQEVE